MNDFDYDVLQKKRLGYGARHMKRGSKSRRCSLPSDHLTAAQLKGRNGPVNTYNLEKPMTWEDFKAMPKDLQQSYIASLQSRFGVGTTTISKELFGLSAVSLRQHMTRHGLTYDAGFNGVRPGIHWNRWLAEDTAEPAVDPDEELTHAEAEAEIREIEGTDKKKYRWVRPKSPDRGVHRRLRRRKLPAVSEQFPDAPRTGTHPHGGNG